MTALSADSSAFSFVESLGNGGFVVDLPLESGTTIYRGALVGYDGTSGYGTAMTTADKFYGVALEGGTGGATNGLNTCKVQVGGLLAKAVASTTQAKLGAVVYCTDDGTLTMVATAGEMVGRLVHAVSTTEGLVELKMPGWDVVGAQTTAAQ